MQRERVSSEGPRQTMLRKLRHERLGLLNASHAHDARHASSTLPVTAASGNDAQYHFSRGYATSILKTSSNIK